MAIEAERLLAIFEAKFDSLDKAVARSRRETQKGFTDMEASGKRLNRTLESVASRGLPGMQKVSADLRRTRAESDAFTRSLGGVGRGLAATFAGAFSIRGAQQLIDTATRIRNALKVTGLEGDQLAKVYETLYQSAQRNATPLESLVTLYSRVAQAQDSLGVSQAQLINFTDKIGVALRVAGTDAQSASGALLQLSQALGSGTVRAEEFNSINEGARPILQAVAAGLEEAGGSVSRLRQLVLDGKVSSEAFFRAFEAGAPMLEEKVKTAEATVSQRFVRLQNVLVDTAGKLDAATGATERVGGGLDRLSGIVEGVGQVIEAAATGPVGTMISKLEQLNGLLQKVEPLSRGLNLLTGDNLGAVADAIRPTSGLQAQIDEKRAEIARLEEGLRKINDSGARAKVADLQREISELQTELRTAKDRDLVSAGGRGGAGGASPSPTTPSVKTIKLSDYPVGSDADTQAASGAGARAGRAYGTSFQDQLRRYLVAGQSASHVENLQTDFAERLSAFLNAAPGGGISIYSGARSFERQAQLFSAAVKKYGSVEAARKWVAPPGSSQHNKGAAADLRFASDAARRWAHENAPIYGLNFRMGHEPWHVEMAKDGVTSVRALDDAWKDVRVTAADTSAVTAQRDAYSDLAQVGVTALQGLADALSDGKLEGKEVLKILIDIVQQLLTMPMAGGAGGGGQSILGSLLGGLFGFDRGGYTGPGGRKQPAGLVHKGEVVFNQDDVRRHGGPAATEALRRGMMVAADVPRLQTGAAPRREVIDIRLQDDSGRMAAIANRQIRSASGTLVNLSVQNAVRAVDRSFPGMMVKARRDSL